MKLKKLLKRHKCSFMVHDSKDNLIQPADLHKYANYRVDYYEIGDNTEFSKDPIPVLVIHLKEKDWCDDDNYEIPWWQ